MSKKQDYGKISVYRASTLSVQPDLRRSCLKYLPAYSIKISLPNFVQDVKSL